MEVTQRKRGLNLGHTTVYAPQKVKYNFDITVLDLMCTYIISKNSNIKKSHIINMRNLFDAIDLSIYDSDLNKLKKINFIKAGIDARLNKDLKNPALILSYINGGAAEGDYTLDDFAMLSNSELNYINDVVSGALKCTFIETEMDTFYDLYVRYKAQDYRYRHNMTDEIEEFIKQFNNKFRKAKADAVTQSSFNLEAEVFVEQLSDIYDTLTAPSRFLKSEMQGFNMITGGGLEATRFYLLLGLAGIGKSMVMLNLALQMKKANMGYQTKDPTKKPTILFLTQENTVDETVDRICNIITGQNMGAFSKSEVIRLLREQGELTLEGDNNINIHIMYRPDRSIDTSDLYTIIEDLEDDGYEVICLIQDHIKRIRSVTKFSDQRLELGAVVNEFKILAQIKQIPVLSVSHLNRDAAAKIDMNSQSNKADMTKLLGRSNIGESLLMVDNADCVLVINFEYDQDGNRYMVFKLLKIRSATPLRDYICQPFVRSSQTRLVTDLNDFEPAFKESLKPESKCTGLPISINGVSIKPSSYNNIEHMESEIDITNSIDNIFGTDNPLISRYSSKSMEEEKIIAGPSPVAISIIPTPGKTVVNIPTIKANHSGATVPLVEFY